VTTNPFVRLLHRVATGDPRRRALLTPLGPLLLFGFVAGLFLLARRTDAALGLPALPPVPANRLLALPFLAGGAGLVLWCGSRFRRARGTPVPFNPPRELVVDGPYAVSRNPMMTGLFSVLLGAGIRLQSPSWVLVYLPLFVLLMNLQIRRIEEPELELRFGEAYREYRRRTPRFIPRLRRRARPVNGGRRDGSSRKAGDDGDEEA